MIPSVSKVTTDPASGFNGAAAIIAFTVDFDQAVLVAGRSFAHAQ